MDCLWFLIGSAYFVSGSFFNSLLHSLVLSNQLTSALLSGSFPTPEEGDEPLVAASSVAGSSRKSTELVAGESIEMTMNPAVVGGHHHIKGSKMDGVRRASSSKNLNV